MLKDGLGRRTYRLKPSAYIHLGVPFAAEMAGSERIRRLRIPFEHIQLTVAALDHKPVIWAIRHTPTNFTTEFLKGCHAVPLTF